MIAAPILPGRKEELRNLLLTMNEAPGLADPGNKLLPFGEFDTLHFARFVILDDETAGDLEKYYGPEAAFPDAPVYLAFLGDCDGPADELLAKFASRAKSGLNQIFAHCEGFEPGCDLLQWMRAHSVKAAASYVHWIGRTVVQIREEAALHEALRNHLKSHPVDEEPQQLRRALAVAIRENGPKLTPPSPTPLSWQLRRLSYLAAAAVALLLALFPFLTLGLCSAFIVYGVFLSALAAAFTVFLVKLRRHEQTDPEVLTPPTDAHLMKLGAIQDFDVTNPYNAFGTVKPVPFWRRTMTVIWALVDLATPVLYPRGNLARVITIHFARWVFLDNKRRAFFASNFDGSSEAYMDDFVNKVPFGLNLTFAHGIGYPKTRFLIFGGAAREQEFKNTQRRHAVPSLVWYKAYPGLTLFDIARNSRIRQGLEKKTMTDAEIRRWLAEI
ncbi:MAG TPA: hypothetical protein VFG05_06360 [Methylocella sp.]|nr:hypothetical protein [Methylocella sp.]